MVLDFAWSRFYEKEFISMLPVATTKIFKQTATNPTFATPQAPRPPKAPAPAPIQKRTGAQQEPQSPKRQNTGSPENNFGANLATADQVRRDLDKVTDTTRTLAAWEEKKAAFPAEMNFLFAQGKTCKNCFLLGKGMGQAHYVKACKGLGNACAMSCTLCKNGIHFVEDCPLAGSSSPKKGKGKGGKGKK